MKRIFIKLIAHIMVVCICCGICTVAMADNSEDEIKRIDDTVYDFSSQQTDELQARLTELTKKLKVGLAVYNTTVDDINSSDFVHDDMNDAKTYAEWVLPKQEYGYGKKNSCAILFMYYNENEFELYTNGYGNTAFSDEAKLYLERSLTRKYKDTENLYDVFSLYMDLCDEIIGAKRAGEEYIVPEIPQNPRLVDNAELLSSEDFAAIEEKINEISEKYNFDIVILTEKTISYDSWQYAEHWFNNNEYGMGESSKDGIMLLISIGSGREGERDWATYTTPNYSKAVFNDNELSEMENKVLEYLRPSNYVDAFKTFIDESDKMLAKTTIERYREQEYYDEIFKEQEEYKKEMQRKEDYFFYVEELPMDGVWIVISIFLGILVSFIILAGMKKAMSPVRLQPDADTYVKPGSFNLSEKQDLFLYRTVTKVRRSDDSGSGSSGSSGGSGSSGSSGGGGHSGKF